MGAVRRAWITALIIVLVGASFLAGYAMHPATTSTSITATSSPSTTAPATWTAAWPDTASTVRYTSPTAAALGFCEHILRMTSPVALTFQGGDARSGEVPILTSDTGPMTTVLVRQLTGDDTWWVLGAISGALQIATPRALSTLRSPLRITGHSTAFEGTINLALYEDGSGAPLASGTAMGGSMGEMGPFSATLRYPRPHANYGTLVLYTLSARDGSVLEASAIRVALR